MLFIGPTALSGIGQQLRKYMKLFPDCKCIEINDEIRSVKMHLFMHYLFNIGLIRYLKSNVKLKM